ncbi:MAG: ABC transporter ATP-binding protein, partial [Pseudomonadota bacterium]
PLYLNMRVNDYLLFVGQIHGKSKKEVCQNLEKIIQQCGLSEVTHRLIGNLSKGMKQRVGIAQCLSYTPSIIILDEPMVGLDPSAIVEIRDLIISLGKENTLLLSSHQLHEVNLMCGAITVIHRGKILATGPIEEIAQKVQGQQVIQLEVKRWGPEMEKALRQEFPVANLQMNSLRNGNQQLKVLLSDSQDRREEIGAFLSKQNVGLLSLSEERLNLEEIFNRITHNDDRREV